MTGEKKSFYSAQGTPTDPNRDYIVRATALGGQVRALGIRSTTLTKDALHLHNASPVAAAALGRFLTGSLLLADTLKNEKDTQTTNIRCNGPLQGMTAVCDSAGHVRGYCNQPIVENTFHYPGKLDVGTALGTGILTVIRDSGFKEPYVGSVELISGEIAEDFTYYLAVSEQTPSVMSLGVLLDSSGIVNAGGFLVQILPGATDETIAYIEKRAGGGFPDVTYLLQEGMNPEQIIDMFLGDPDIQYLTATEVSYACNCSKDRMKSNLITLGKQTIKELSDDPEGIRLECHFCDKVYSFSQEELREYLSMDNGELKMENEFNL